MLVCCKVWNWTAVSICYVLSKRHERLLRNYSKLIGKGNASGIDTIYSCFGFTVNAFYTKRCDLPRLWLRILSNNQKHIYEFAPRYSSFIPSNAVELSVELPPGLILLK